MRLIGLVLVLCACSGGSTRAPTPPLKASSPRLAPPQAIDPSVTGAAYLSALAEQIQPRWAQFLEDCRLRLPAEHPLNSFGLSATFELQIASNGLLHDQLILGSGNGDFNRAVREVLRDVPRLVPPIELESDDGIVHVTWLFARDRRQAGPATASVRIIRQPLQVAVQYRLERGELDRAAVRITNAPLDDSDRMRATEWIMLEVIRGGLERADSATREAAVEVVARLPTSSFMNDLGAVSKPLVGSVHALTRNGATPQRVRAIDTITAVCAQPCSTPTVEIVKDLLDHLDADFSERPEVGLAKLRALVTFGKQREAAVAVGTAFSRAQRKQNVSIETAVAALAIVPDSKLAGEVVRWFERGAPEIRQAICEALPAAAAGKTTAMLARGLRDGDATVRGACASAAARQGKRADRATKLRLVELARDRDEVARASAIAALGALEPSQRPKGSVEDKSSRVRSAAAIGASEQELRALAKDRDPDVRAIALATLAARQKAPELALAAVEDEASQVRFAAIAGLADTTVLEKLTIDADPDVATAALARFAALRGRAATTTELLKRLVAAPPNSLERVRIARAWLLAP